VLPTPLLERLAALLSGKLLLRYYLRSRLLRAELILKR
jgi:hypothetical protein